MPIRTTPYRLVYGKVCHLPVELKHQAYWVIKFLNFDMSSAGEKRKLQMSELEEWPMRIPSYIRSVASYIMTGESSKLRSSKNVIQCSYITPGSNCSQANSSLDGQDLS